MIERTLWHPVAAADALAGDTPLAVRLLGDDAVLWRDAHGAVHAALDRCPHRGARLSMGRVRDGAAIECPYHGWRFDGAGRCIAIPAAPGFVPPALHGLRAYEATVAYGFVWLRFEPGDEALPSFDAEREPALRKLLVGPYDVDTSAPRIVENFIDVAHFGVVHAGWLGDAEHMAVEPYAVAQDAHGVRLTGVRAWQPQSHAAASGGSLVAYDYTVTAPYTAVLTKVPAAEADFRESIGLFVCPVEPERSRVWFRLAVPVQAADDEALRRFQHTIFAQDQPVLESQRPKRLPLSGSEVHGAADRGSSAYRRYLAALGAMFGVC